MSTDFVGRGVDFPLRVRSTGAVATVGGTDNLEKAMRIILLTYLGERPMRPRFGSRLRDFLFEGVTPQCAVAISQEVERAITSCEPRVRVDDVDVRSDYHGNGWFDIDITYTVLATNARENLVLPFYTIPGEED
jgi:phage baseplate assembly protein W